MTTKTAQDVRNEGRETQQVLLYTPLRRIVEDAIRQHGAGSNEVDQIIYGSPLKDRTPNEIDTFLYALVVDAYRLSDQIRYAVDTLHHVVSDKRRYGSSGIPLWTLDLDETLRKVSAVAGDPSQAGYIREDARKALVKYNEAVEAKETNLAVQNPLQIEYSRRPWTRAFLVTDGHVHSSTGCSTCFPTTRFTWLTSLSGKDEAEIVSLAGERACTVCYPTAPTLRSFEKASPLFTEEEAERNAAREQRAAEKAERQAKKIAKGLTEDGSEFVVVTEEGVRPDDYFHAPSRGQAYQRREHFKTEQAAVQWVVSNRTGYWADRRSETVKAAEEAVLEAVVAKRVRQGLVTGSDVLPDVIRAEVDAEIAKKVEAKRRRDSRGY